MSEEKVLYFEVSDEKTAGTKLARYCFGRKAVPGAKHQHRPVNSIRGRDLSDLLDNQ